MNTKAIIFDFFDVFQRDAYKAWLTANDFPNIQEYAAASRLLDKGMLSSSEFLQRLSDLSGQKVTWESMGVGGAINAEVVAVAAALKERCSTALLSNAPSALLRGILAENDLERLFDQIVISSEVGYAKPDPGIFTIALDRLGVRPRDTVFIDDNSTHTSVAETLGIRGIQFLSVSQLKEELSQLEIL
ncbi:HAD-IA family hydrolase [Streptomyces caniscabiei]|uniref:HAD-IA family hydrolase n=1 Tax=Streptomyces caniscabiei TaxID=2746961 RepID=UPI0029A6850B|nr:HAD-IA family hydrolase [Streptomyces caniscabiei]MDX2775794.1 HAD-IA family hydrolase [Streptomyces caniscabiei]